jgi:flagellar hook-length control protein FliK
VAQVDSGVRWMLKSGSQEARLQLHPDSLGQVTIHLRVEGGEVHARLWVSEAASMKAVQDGRSHLELSLKEQGLQLGSFDLQQGHRPFQDAPAAQASPFQDRLSTLPARQETPATKVPTLANPHQIELYA